VGRVLDYLDKIDLTKNTVVILSSDQGFYLGEHGWFDKRWIFEESLRSPLLMRWPGVIKPGSTSSELVSLLDFSSTFLDIAQAPPMEGVHGRSLVPIMKGETPADWRKSHYFHYYEFPVPHRVRPHYGVVTDRYKLVHYYAPDVNDWELLDRQKDPLEVKDFYTDPSYADTVKELKAEIIRLQAQFGETVPPPRFTHGNKAFDNEPQPPEQPKKKGKGKKKAE
jgi:arylsulfatase A-like enzyme